MSNFNNDEVDFLAIKDNSQPNNELFKVFERNDIINILQNLLFQPYQISSS